MPNNDNELENQEEYMPPMSFENAYNATVDLLNHTDDGQETEGAPAETPETANTEEQPEENTTPGASENMPPAPETTPETANSAQNIQQPMQQPDISAQLQQQIDQLQQQNQTLQDTITQMSEAQRENIVDNAMKPPTLDLRELAFMDDEETAAMQQQYAQQMSDYLSEKIRGEIAEQYKPYIDAAKNGMREREKNNVISALKSLPEMADIEQNIDTLDRIIAGNAGLNRDDIPIDEKYVAAYAIMKGVDAMQHAQNGPTIDELMSYYDSNEDFRKAVAKKRVEDLAGKDVPPMYTGSGGNVALNIPEKPRTWDEASERTRHMFGDD